MAEGPPNALLTERLLLRPYTREDLGAWHRQIFADPEVMRYLPGGQPIPREQLDGAYERGAKHWQDHGYGVWVVCDRSTQELIGHCGLRFLDEIAETEVLYGLGRRYWGRGLATEAARAALEFGFGRAGLQRIVAFAVPANIASRKVMEHLGMQLEETQRSASIWSGTPSTPRDSARPWPTMPPRDKRQEASPPSRPPLGPLRTRPPHPAGSRNLPR